MTLSELISPHSVACNLHVTSKKQLFQEMAELIVGEDVVDAKEFSVRDIVSAAMDRERLGSTGVGSGVALPHARLEGLDRVHAALARLEEPLEYDSIDERPVDLVVLLLAPNDAGSEHLRALAQVSRRMRREDVRARLRTAPNAESLHISLLNDPEANAA